MYNLEDEPRDEQDPQAEDLQEMLKADEELLDDSRNN